MTEDGVGGNIVGIYEPKFENTAPQQLPRPIDNSPPPNNPKPLPRMIEYPRERKEGLSIVGAWMLALLTISLAILFILGWIFVQAIDDGKVGIDQEIKPVFFQNTTNNYEIITENTFSNDFNQTFVFHFYLDDLNFTATS